MGSVLFVLEVRLNRPDTIEVLQDSPDLCGLVGELHALRTWLDSCYRNVPTSSSRSSGSARKPNARATHPVPRHSLSSYRG